MELGTAGAPESAATGADVVAILTTEPGLLESLREAAPQLTLLGAGSVGELARLLGAHPCRALGVDFATVGNGGLGMMERLAALFPELPLVVIGAPEDEPFVTPLIDRGVVWRFLAKPPGREPVATVLGVAARIGRERTVGVELAADEEDDLDDDGDEIRDEDPDEDEEEDDEADARERRPAAQPFQRGAPGRRPFAPAPAGAPPRLDTPVARRELPGRPWQPSGRSAPDTPPRAPDAAGGRGGPGATTRPPLGRWPTLSKTTWAAVAGAALLAVLALAVATRGRAPTTPTAATGPPVASVAERAPPGVATLVAAGDLALARGALVAPLGTSAIDYYRRAVALDPGNEAARTGLSAVADALLRDADAAFADGRLPEAESAVRAAALARPDDPRVGALLARVRDAGTRDEGRAAARGTSASGGGAPVQRGANAPRVAASAAAAVPTTGARPSAGAAPPDGAGARGGSEAARPAGAQPANPAGGAATVASAATAPTDAAPGAGPRAPAAAAAPGTPSDGVVTTGEAATPAGRGPGAADEPPQRVSGQAPVFPQRARADGIEGWVDVQFTIDTRGMPRDIRVVGAQPAGTFDRSVERAIATWRYVPPSEPRSIRMRVRFQVGD